MLKFSFEAKPAPKLNFKPARSFKLNLRALCLCVKIIAHSASNSETPAVGLAQRFGNQAALLLDIHRRILGETFDAHQEGF